MTFSLWLALLPALAAPRPTPSDTPAAAEVRAAVGRSLPYLEKEGTAWIHERNCASCHVVPFLIWSHNEARAAGVPVNAPKLDEWTTWTLDYSLNARQWFKLTDAAVKQLTADGLPEPILGKLRPLHDRPFVTEGEFRKAVGPLLTADERGRHEAAILRRAAQPRAGEKTDGGSMAAMAQLLLGRVGSRNARLDAFLAAAPAQVVRWQEANGSWGAAGQLPRQHRPRAEADAVTTGWMVLGLAPRAKNDPQAGQAVDAGLAFVRQSPPGKSHELRVVRLLVEDRFGPPAESARRLGEVLAAQNADGGWGWQVGGPSDAFATGQTLYALGQLGSKVDAAALHRTQRYLLTTQTTEGTWDVPPAAITDPASNAARLKKLVPIYRFWGTAWAAIGLSRSLQAGEMP